eukprot:7605777-Pyramimonas_sp.AAC.1
MACTKRLQTHALNHTYCIILVANPRCDDPLYGAHGEQKKTRVARTVKRYRKPAAGSQRGPPQVGRYDPSGVRGSDSARTT